MKRASDQGPETSGTRFSELFASMINHEMRNALNVVSTAASLLELRADSEKIATPVTRIALSASRMERMLSQLVDFTRIELDGALVLIREPVDLAELAESLVEQLPVELKARVVIKSEGDVQGRWDRDRLAQTLSTLILNALHHGTPNGQARLTIQTEPDGGYARNAIVDIENEGEMPEAVLDDLFTPKRRPAAPAHTPSGLGLGLYVAQHVAHAHGGQLEASSAQGRTRFSLRLPAVPAPLTAPKKVASKHA